MASATTNVIANFVGSIWTALFTIIFVPLYLPYIGIEAYGLVGIFTGIQALTTLLDFGLSPTLNRELARLSALENQSQTMHDLKKTLEVPNWIAACVIALLLAAAAPLVAAYWIQPKTLTITTITQSFIIMSISIAIQFTASFYVGGLLGLQKQLPLNIIYIICSTLRSAGAFLVVVFISPTIQAFLLWQGFVAILQLIAVAFLLKRSLPEVQEKGSFQKELLQKVWRFAAGMTGITIVSLILTQTDKVILSRMLSLEDFGYYTLAITVAAMAVATIVGSITNSVYPKFSRFVSLDDEVGLREFYHRSCQILSAFLIPVVVVIAAFAYQILLIWTRKEIIADNTHLLLSVVIIGTGLNGLMWLPYHLQLAYGWTKLVFYGNLAAIVFLVPLMVVGTYKYGAIGGALSFVLLNILYILILIQIMHRRLLKGEQWKWYFQDVLLPLGVSILIIFTGKYLFNENWVALVKVLYIGFLTAFSFGSIIAVTPQLRDWSRYFLSKVLK